MYGSTQPHSEQRVSVGSPWAAVWRKWSAGVLTTPVMLAAHVAVALIAPSLFNGGTLRFVLTTALTTLVAGLVAGLLCRSFGLYAERGPDGSLHDPQRQGICSAQLGLLLAAPIFTRLGIAPGWLPYLAAYMLVSIAGSESFRLAAGRPESAAATIEPETMPTAVRTADGDTRQLPRWAQRAAGVCLALGALALIRLALGGASYFLWGGLALLALGVLLPAVARPR